MEPMLQDSFQAYLAAFRAADPDGRGLSYLEFQTMLTPLSLTQLQLQSLMRAFDFNGDAMELQPREPRSPSRRAAVGQR